MIWLILLATALLLAIGSGTILWEALYPPRRTSGWAVAQRLPIDPGEAGLPYREWTLERPDGARLPVWEVDLDAHGDGITLVLLHGWARSRIDSLDRLLSVIGAVPEAIRSAVLIDLRGHGEATGPGCRIGAREIDDVLELLRRTGDAPIVLGGHSMGAVIAIAAAARAEPALRARLRGVIAWAPYRRVGTPIANRLRFRGAPSMPLVPLALLAARRIVPVTMDTATIAASLNCALLVFAAARDTVAPPEDAAAIAEAGDGTLVTLPTASHGNIHNADGDLHAEALRRWFAAQLDPARAASSET